MPTIVSQIAVCARDPLDSEILEIYAKKEPDYAVYRTNSRVTIKFADDPAKEVEQRAVLAKLNPLRGDINALIDGWRGKEGCVDCGNGRNLPRAQLPELWWIFNRPPLSSWLTYRKARFASKARRYDRSVADGLILALENDFDTGLAQLEKTKADIVAERTSRARYEYLMVALLVCLGLIAAGWEGWKTYPWPQNDTVFFYGLAAYLLLAAGAGSVGAFFSVAIAIRSRTILTDLRRRDNSMDAALRITIGAIGAAFLVGALIQHAFSFKLGALSSELIKKDGPDWLSIILFSFVAGFSERLVPDLLAKTAGAMADPKDETKPAKPADPKVANGDGAKPAALDDPGAGEDCCNATQNLTDKDATDDADLPAAAGGVTQ